MAAAYRLFYSQPGKVLFPVREYFFPAGEKVFLCGEKILPFWQIFLPFPLFNSENSLYLQCQITTSA